MFTIHGNNHCIPDLGDKNFGFVLDFHLSCSEELGVNSFRKPGVNIFPRCPNGKSSGKRTPNTEDDDPDDIPEVGVQEKEDEIHNIHNGQSKWDMISA